MAERALGTGATVGEGAVRKTVTGGEAITVGMPVYKDSSTNEHMKGLADSAAHAAIEGIAVTASGDGQELVIVSEGLLGGLTGLTVGEWYVVSDATAGYIMPVSDLGAGNYGTLVGYAPTATTFQVKIVKSGVAHG